MTAVQATGKRVREPATEAARRPLQHRTLRGWLAARLLRVLSAILRRLPEGALHRAAYAFGGLLYRLQPERRHLVRANLERVVTYLAERKLGGDVVSNAASDSRALDRLTRAAFGHYVRGYLEGAILPTYASLTRLERVQPDDPAVLEQAFGVSDRHGQPAPVIIVGMHFGAIEIPALWASKRLGRRITAPMETIGDPDLQAYFERTRKETGLGVIPVADAATQLRESLGRGETIALVADRPVGGSGVRVELFGVPCRLPLGPAALALESGVPAWLVATRRTDSGDYRARIEQLSMPATGTRRERLSAFMTAEARAFERAIADAPEQWWTAFFPVWEDISA